MINLTGTFPTEDGFFSPSSLGAINIFAGNFAPEGSAFLDGQLLSINQHAALFSIIGTTYGGDGTTTFALPDLRGRTPVGMGQGTGLTNRSLGEEFGAASVALNIDQIPAHTHDVTLPAAVAQATALTADLIDAALAVEWLNPAALMPTESSAQPESTENEVFRVTLREDFTPTLVPETQLANASELEPSAEDTDRQAWLAEELLERVFS